MSELRQRHGPTRQPVLDPERPHNADLNPYLQLHKEFGPEVITASDAVGYRGRWADAYGRQAPLHVEIGSGNGFFLSGMAALHPEQDWLGVEIRYKRVVLCARKIQARGVHNARIVRYDAWRLADLFEPGSVAGLYVNHPDPWPKERQANKRLLGPVFCAWAAEALAPGAELRLKTDALSNVELLEASIAGLPFEITGRVLDIRANGVPWGVDEVITNYQRKFYEKGVAVHALGLRRL